MMMVEVKTERYKVVSCATMEKNKGQNSPVKLGVSKLDLPFLFFFFQIFLRTIH